MSEKVCLWDKEKAMEQNVTQKNDKEICKMYWTYRKTKIIVTKVKLEKS